MSEVMAQHHKHLDLGITFLPSCVECRRLRSDSKGRKCVVRVTDDESDVPRSYRLSGRLKRIKSGRRKRGNAGSHRQEEGTHEQG